LEATTQSARLVALGLAAPRRDKTTGFTMGGGEVAVAGGLAGPAMSNSSNIMPLMQAPVMIVALVARSSTSANRYAVIRSRDNPLDVTAPADGGRQKKGPPKRPLFYHRLSASA
jgi:hypothetical protein